MSCKTGSSYIIKTGDTLSSVAQQQLHNSDRWHEILKPDGTSFKEEDASKLQIGQEVCIPHSGNGSTGGSTGDGFANIVSRQTFETMFPNRNQFYTYESLIAATQKYPQFCNEGSLEQRKREAAAFLANVSHETGGLQYIEEQNPQSNYCQANTTYPCAAGKNYHGRGPIQLSWNYNYGACGQAIGKDVLNNPELVSTDSAISFMTALWFWMTPQPPKTSCHNAINTSGFGMTINIINGGIECGKGQPTSQAQHRIQLYQQFTGMLGVTPGENLSC
ncbi:glycoside hydrolase family 19 protein [uncultured Nostoc sp.]|uniref:glycoside hydrolase family 19 protein n=1 Tax=uncultured Nostoc sp. TaxID=340711 RepID=UPI0035CA88C3